MYTVCEKSAKYGDAFSKSSSIYSMSFTTLCPNRFSRQNKVISKNLIEAMRFSKIEYIQRLRSFGAEPTKDQRLNGYTEEFIDIFD